MTFSLNTLRKEQISSKHISPNTIRGIIDFSTFNPTKVLQGDIWISSSESPQTINDVIIYYQDLVIANVNNPGALTLSSIANNKWGLSRKRLFMDGTRTTGVHGGVLFDTYIDNDYLYLCVIGGEIGTAVWKKIHLLLT